MRSCVQSWAAAVIAMAVAACWGVSQEIWQGSVCEPALEQFEVAGDGDTLLLPITFLGKQYLFALDTGSTVTVYDSSLPLGRPRHQIRTETSNDDVTVGLFDAPDALLGKLAFRPGPSVLGADLRSLRQVSGHEISGIVGMDFLSRHVVRIDFGSEQVAFLRSAGPNLGRPVRLHREEPGPCVEVEVAGVSLPEKFLIDTGSSGFGRVTSELAERLVKNGKAKEVGGGMTATLSGTKVRRRWRVESIVVVGFEHRDVVLTESRDNVLGLGCWCGYDMTLDFLSAVAYLKQSSRPDRPCALDMSGMHLLRVQGETVVHSVDEGSPAAASGVRPKDVLLKIDGRKAHETRLFTLRRLLCAEGKELRITLRRGTAHAERTMLLRNWR